MSGDAIRRELPIPDAALRDGAARELVRVWAAEGAQHVALTVGPWKDPAAWGIALADLARHVARAYEQVDGTPKERVLERVREAFEAEGAHPTDDPTGRVG